MAKHQTEHTPLSRTRGDQPAIGDATQAARRDTLFLIAGTIVCVLLFTLMAFVTWRRWPDVLVDFGQEQYVPWQMLQGKLLYRDIAYLFGAVTPAFNALVFWIFGVSCTTFFLTNLVLLTVFLVILWRLLAQATSQLNAFLCVAVVILVFGFAQYVQTGNYNFISPYTPTATHGTILATMLVYLLSQWYRRPDSRWHGALSGLVFGLVLLTRTEIGVAAALAVGAFIVIASRFVRGYGVSRRSFGAFLAGTFLPWALFLLYFATRMTLKQAVVAVANPWILLTHRDLWANAFFRHGMGTDDVLGNLALVIRDAAIVAVALASLLAVSHYAWRRGRQLWLRGLGILIAAGLVWFSFQVSLSELGRPLPLLCGASLVLLLISWWGNRKESPADANRDAALILWAAFSIGLLSKMLLFSRVYHYGFYLGLPAALLICSIAFWFIPTRLGKRLHGMTMYRVVVLCILLVVAGQCAWHTWNISRYKTFEVGDGPDRVRTYPPQLDPRGDCVAQALAWLKQNTTERDTLTVLPEGISINYWARRVNPIRITNCQMTEILLFGEEAILQDLKDHSPDYILLVPKNTSEFGVGYFGTDPRYGMHIMNWIREKYAPVLRFTSVSLQEERFTIMLLRKAGATF